MAITIELGFYYWRNSDTTDNLSNNLKTLQRFLNSSTIEYKVLHYDSSIKNAVVISLSERNAVYWHSFKSDWGNYKPIPITNEQDGSRFVITEVKEVSIDGQRNNSIIIKGSFTCNVFEERTGAKKVLTNGAFTCVLLA